MLISLSCLKALCLVVFEVSINLIFPLSVHYLNLSCSSWHCIIAVLVSRQFVDMSRIRIEGLLAAFPKLIGSGKQHTYVETENVRYVYQPIEMLYLLLVTNKQSNILEDLETLRLLSKLVSFFFNNLYLPFRISFMTPDNCFYYVFHDGFPMLISSV